MNLPSATTALASLVIKSSQLAIRLQHTESLMMPQALLNSLRVLIVAMGHLVNLTTSARQAIAICLTHFAKTSQLLTLMMEAIILLSLCWLYLEVS